MGKASTKRGKRSAAYGEPPGLGHRIRIRLVLWVFMCAFGLIVVRLAYLQMDPGLQLRAENQRHLGTVTIKLPRGDIKDRHGKTLATDRMAPSVYANPQAIRDPEAFAAELSRKLDLDPEVLLERFTRRTEDGELMQMVAVKRWVEAAEIEALGNLAAWEARGLRIKHEPERFYPEGDLAAHVLGFVNRERKGSAGVEMMYDSYLASTPGQRVARKDGRRRLIASLTEEYVQPQGGGDVQLTLDASMQHALESALDAALERAKAPRAMGLLMSVDTGAILAMACRPAYNPNRYYDYPQERLKNRAVTDVFEPGSAFKIVPAAAALEHGLITPSTEFDCENGVMYMGRRRIQDYHKLGVEPFTMCFAESSNIAIIKVASLLGPDRMDEWIRRFGFGATTSRDFSAESVGIYHPKSQWSGYTMGSLPMGQELSVTMLQLARAFSAVANGGYLVEPYVVERVTDQDGVAIYNYDYPAPKRILSAKTARTMRDLCHLVVQQGTGEYARMDAYRAGGKTGTAQMADLQRGGYLQDKYTTIFAGFAPMSDPRVCAVIVVQEPSIRLHYGGYVCGPVFKEVVRNALISMNVPEDAPKELLPLPEAEPLDPDTVLARMDLSVLEPPEELIALEGVELINASKDKQQRSSPPLPDFDGMTKQEALEELIRVGVNWDFQGAGWVVEQDPAPGTPSSEVALCRLRFASKVAMANNQDETHEDE